ncbi:cytochrome c oxidase subunit II [Oceanobacillus jordanicus]|uniref:Cytochrome c oxidase subunit 2 n=1 Tax=Oceanobacillus jordanicus TaxID=2867266 RepID=A0AAW5B2G8_9BACI|nr:cytochrome c oxidase subunit II [Oceanobacillus jordanicus]MCG3417885.1 cytochrome c oxidase subunit II [Oceanobacillus jordanicus]
MKRLLVMPFLLLLTGCNIKVLDSRSDTANDQAFLIIYSFSLMLIVVLVVSILFIRFVFKYRYTEERKDNIPPDVKGNKWLETAWVIGPLLLLAILAVPTIMMTYDQSPVLSTESEQEGTSVQVTAEQFNWTFEHANGKTEQNRLVIPEGGTILLHLKSEDVIHSFWVPRLGGKVDVMPDRELVYEIKNPQIGTYEGKCAEYCGLGHTNMKFEAEVVSADEYASYLNEK